MPVEAKIKPEYNHTAMRVRDLEASVKFYTDVVGLKVLRSSGDASRPSAVFLPGIQLVRAESQNVAEKGVLDHIGLSITNMDDVVGNLKAAGVALEEPGVRDMTQPGGPKVRIAFFRDNEGNRVELVEREA